MLKLKPLTGTYINEHLVLLRDRFYRGLLIGLSKLEPTDPYDQSLLEFLFDKLDQILVGSPQELEGIARDVARLFPAFNKYALRYKKGTAARDLVHKHTFAVIESCFDYDKFSEKVGSWHAYALVCAHALRICPYCQAHHVNYYVDPNAATVEEQFRIRPPLDHFFPKSRYPYFAVSLHNLVPSCVQCNSSVKSSDDPLALGLSNPHDPATPINIKFSAIGSIPARLNGTVDDIEISLVARDPPSETLMGAFLLEKRYQWYKHEIKDLIDRYDAHCGLPSTLRSLVPVERFVLGCDLLHVDKRMIGFCLRDIYEQLLHKKVA